MYSHFVSLLRDPSGCGGFVRLSGQKIVRPSSVQCFSDVSFCHHQNASRKLVAVSFFVPTTPWPTLRTSPSSSRTGGCSPASPGIGVSVMRAMCLNASAEINERSKTIDCPRMLFYASCLMRLPGLPLHLTSYPMERWHITYEMQTHTPIFVGVHRYVAGFFPVIPCSLKSLLMLHFCLSSSSLHCTGPTPATTVKITHTIEPGQRETGCITCCYAPDNCPILASFLCCYDYPEYIVNEMNASR